VYTDDDAFAGHSASEVFAAATPVFTELIAASDVVIGETLICHGLGLLIALHQPCRASIGTSISPSYWHIAALVTSCTPQTHRSRADAAVTGRDAG
jgi:hypothetical protein